MNANTLLMAASLLLISAGAMQAGMLGFSREKYRERFVEVNTQPDPDIHLFKDDDYQYKVLFFKNAAVHVEIRKLSGEAFTDAEVQDNLRLNQEGSPWHLAKNGSWVNEDDVIPTAVANVNADKTCVTIANLKAMSEMTLDDLGKHN